jgi:hypothetical protein
MVIFILEEVPCLVLSSWQLKFSLLQVCCHESMQAGQHRLHRLGIKKLTQPAGLASAMNQLPDEAIELAAAAHIERELQITSWNLTSNFVACTNQVLHSKYIIHVFSVLEQLLSPF